MLIAPSAVPFPPRRRLGRIAEMSLAELAYRGRHEASKWLERFARRRADVDPRALLEDRAPGLADSEMALRVLREQAPRRFFAGVEDRSVAGALRERMPDDCRKLVAAAARLVASRRFDVLGYRNVSFGDPVDWHLDPVWARRSPLVHWGQIDPLDPAQVGDSKIVWELNRHQWMVGLGQAWAFTGDERYGDACLESIGHWLDANPPGTGINWASSLEVALRLMSWCWTLLLLRDLPALSGGRLTRILSAIWQHAAHIRRYLSYYFSPNTHLTAEALGLFYAGSIFPEFSDAPGWRELGARVLIAQSARQISGDGVHFEQSTCYHRYTIEIYLHFLLLADRNGIAIPRQVTERIARMIDVLIALRQPDGSIPVIGDADGGTLLPLARRAPHDSRGIFAVAAVMFRRQDFAWASEGEAPEVPWLLGTGGFETFAAIRPSPPEGAASRMFPSGGYAVMRTGWDRDAHQLIVDTGPLGCPASSGHGHADLLSVQCAVFGEPCLVDAGTYCYTTEPEWRDFFRGTSAHSTIQLDGLSQSEPDGPFRWTRRPRVRLRSWQSTPDVDLLDAESSAFLTLSDPVVHRRRVIFVKPRYWIIVDDLAGLSTHQVELMYQFGPIAVAVDSSPWARARTAKGAALHVAAFASSPLHTTLRSGELLPIRGWVSPDYGRRLPAPMLIYSCEASLPWRALTVLLPDRDGISAPPSTRVIHDEAGLPAGLVFDDSGESVRIDERAVCLGRVREWRR
jgi:hypothetical protein